MDNVYEFYAEKIEQNKDNAFALRRLKCAIYDRPDMTIGMKDSLRNIIERYERGALW